MLPVDYITKSHWMHYSERMDLTFLYLAPLPLTLLSLFLIFPFCNYSEEQFLLNQTITVYCWLIKFFHQRRSRIQLGSFLYPHFIHTIGVDKRFLCCLFETKMAVWESSISGLITTHLLPPFLVNLLYYIILFHIGECMQTIHSIIQYFNLSPNYCCESYCW